MADSTPKNGAWCKVRNGWVEEGGGLFMAGKNLMGFEEKKGRRESCLERGGMHGGKFSS